MYHSREMEKRRTALAAAAVLCASQAVDYFVGIPQSPVVEAAWNGYLLPVYAFSWAAVAVLCVVYIPSGKLVNAMSGLCGILLAWGMVWLSGSLGPHFTYRSFKTAIVYGAIGVVIGSLTRLTPARIRSEVDHG